MGNPYITDKKVLFFYFIVLALIGAAATVIMTMLLGMSLIQSVTDSAVSVVIYALIGLSLWYPTKFFHLEDSPLIRIFTNHSAGAVISSVVWSFACFFVLQNIIDDPNYDLGNSLIWRFMVGIILYTLVTSFNYLLIYYNNFKEKTLRENELNALVKEAELNSLKYQIKPHFIFNSLNSISSLTMLDPDKAREMIIKLSDFLRSTLTKSSTQKIKLSEELDNVRLYLDIEKIRFEDKFEYIEEVSPACKTVEVPNLLLQPLFENAIKYGVYENTELVTIKLTCSRQAEYMVISVINNYDNEAIPAKGAGIGINNIKNRLKLIYNQENLLTIKKDQSTFTVHIFIPL